MEREAGLWREDAVVRKKSRRACFANALHSLSSGRGPTSPQDPWDKERGRRLASAVSHRQWPQAGVAAAVNLHDCGTRVTSLCQLCREADGTELHRHECSASRPAG